MTIQEKVDLLSKAAAVYVVLFGAAFALIWWVYERIKTHPLQSYFDTLAAERRDNFYYRAKECVAERKAGLEPPMPWPMPGPLTPAKFQIGQPVIVDNKRGQLLELTIVSRSYFPHRSMWMYSFGDESKGYGEDLIQDSPNYVRVASKDGHQWVSLNDQTPAPC